MELALKLIENGAAQTAAAKEAAKQTGFKKGDIYKAILAEEADTNE